MAAVEKCFHREIAALDDIFSFIHNYFADNNLDPKGLFDASLVIEELFTNMVRHASDGRHDILLALDRDGDELVISLTDFNVKPWDPTLAPQFDPDQPLESRGIGGMGVHLVRNLARSFTYEHREGESITTVRTGLSG